MQITKNALSGLVTHAPTFLFVSMLLSFILMFLVQMFYYSNLLMDAVPMAFAYVMAFAIGLMFQFSRLAFGIAGAAEFSQGNTAKGITGMIFSLGLSIFESFEVSEIAMIWNDNLYHSSLMILQSIVWLGFLLEIRLAINLSRKSNPKNIPVVKKQSNGVVRDVIGI